MWELLLEGIIEFILNFRVEECQTKKRLLVITLVRNLVSLSLCTLLAFICYVSLPQSHWKSWWIFLLLFPFLLFHLYWWFSWNVKSYHRFKQLHHKE